MGTLQNGKEPRKVIPSFEELKKLSCSNNDEVFSKEAMNNLPQKVKDLLNVDHQAKFLENICLLAEDEDFSFNRHIIFGIVQLAHSKYENLSGSKRTGFRKEVIPFLLEIKEKIIKKDMDSDEIKKIIIKQINS